MAQALDNDTVAGDVPDANHGPGGRLRKAREQHKLGIDAVASALRVPRPLIEALERDDYAQLVAPVFVRGYIKSYARLLKIPVEPLLAAYNRQGVHEPALSVRDTVRMGHGSRSGLRGLAGLLLLIAAGVALLWWWNHAGQRLWALDPARVVAESASLDVPLPAQIPDVPLPEYPAEATSPDGASSLDVPAVAGPFPDNSLAVALQTSSPVQNEPDAVIATQPIAPTAAVSEAPTPQAATDTDPVVPAAATDPAPPVGPHTLVLRFRDLCWVNVRDATGERLLYGLIAPGATQVLTGKPPYQLVFGNSPAVEVEYGGHPFDQSRYNVGNVARFNVGE